MAIEFEGKKRWTKSITLCTVKTDKYFDAQFTLEFCFLRRNFGFWFGYNSENLNVKKCSRVFSTVLGVFAEDVVKHAKPKTEEERS